LLVVKRVSKGKPAEEAGILPGDKIIKVGNIDLIKSGKDLQETLSGTPTPLWN
jgi:C-terminal processing protease CtpA/Prc